MKALALALGSLLAFSPAHAADIEDNSFLIEEAFNQPEGVVQFVQTYRTNNATGVNDYTLSGEIPMGGQDHQLSFVVPHFSAKDANNATVTGFGDPSLNYRYQLIDDERVLMAPRIGVLLPTGDFEKGFGTGAVGYQTNLAATVRVTKKWITHFNAGFTLVPGAKDPAGEAATTLAPNFGASVVYLLSDNLNFLTEFVTTSLQRDPDSVPGGTAQTGDAWQLLPGIRGAWNVSETNQIVAGFGLPIGLGPNKHEYGAFFYLSVEPKLW